MLQPIVNFDHELNGSKVDKLTAHNKQYGIVELQKIAKKMIKILGDNSTFYKKVVATYYTWNILAHFFIFLIFDPKP